MVVQPAVLHHPPPDLLPALSLLFPQEVQAPVRAQPGQLLEARFQVAQDAPNYLHWLRPSLLCAASVSQHGHLQVAAFPQIWHCISKCLNGIMLGTADRLWRGLSHNSVGIPARM